MRDDETLETLWDAINTAVDLTAPLARDEGAGAQDALRAWRRVTELARRLDCSDVIDYAERQIARLEHDYPSSGRIREAQA
jgi:DNA-binding helix-hairpin-helix protein with protein kinase domain